MNHCWDIGSKEFDAVFDVFPDTSLDYLTQSGFQMEFVNQIIEEVKKPLDENYEYIFDVGDYGPTISTDINAEYRWGQVAEGISMLVVISIVLGGLVAVSIIPCIY